MGLHGQRRTFDCERLWNWSPSPVTHSTGLVMFLAWGKWWLSSTLAAIPQGYETSATAETFGRSSTTLDATHAP